MAKGICPVCESLEYITTTGEPIGWVTPSGGSFAMPSGSACWWSVCMHPDKREAPNEEGRYPICLGSGKKI